MSKSDEVFKFYPAGELDEFDVIFITGTNIGFYTKDLVRLLNDFLEEVDVTNDDLLFWLFRKVKENENKEGYPLF